jgi:hypothetical protein
MDIEEQSDMPAEGKTFIPSMEATKERARSSLPAVVA